MARRLYLYLLVATGCTSASHAAHDAGTLPPPSVDGGTIADATEGETMAADAQSDAAPTIDSSSMDAEPDGADAAGPYPPRRTADEILLVVNSNSPTSTAIGNAYVQARSITNVVTVGCADSALSADNETMTLGTSVMLLTPSTRRLLFQVQRCSSPASRAPAREARSRSTSTGWRAISSRHAPCR